MTPTSQYASRPLAGLSGTQLLLLDELRYLADIQAQKGGKGCHYAMPSRAYLAAKTGCSIVTVSRHISRLVADQWITRVQRRPRAGVYQTNLYRLNQLLAHGPRKLIASLQAALNRVSHVIHKPKNHNYKEKRSAASGARSGGSSAAHSHPLRTRPADTPHEPEKALAALDKIRAILAPQTPRTA